MFCLGKAIPHSGDLGEARVFFMSRRWHQSRIRCFIFSEPVARVVSYVTDDCVPPALPHLPLEAPHAANGSGHFMNEHGGIHACEVD